ncbi:hypothetical protein JXA63_03030 [Candidatus Woesebacteria bacterium]|nr:hypothetical protein [Candidatus Woesebacteria bacterium]
MRKLFLSLAIFLISLFVTASQAYASFGISPADLTFRNLIPGSSIERKFFLSRTDLSEDAEVVVETDVEGANSWIDIEPGFSFIIPEGEKTKEMNVVVSVPKDAPLKSYTGFINVKTGSKTEGEGVPIVNGVAVSVNLVTTLSEDLELLVRKIQIPNIFVGDPIKIVISVENLGNVAAVPDVVDLYVYDSSGNSVIRKQLSNLPVIEPSQVKEYSLRVENDLPLGEYSAEILVKYKGKAIREERLVFSVTERFDRTKTSWDNKNASLFFMGILLVIIPLLFILRAILRIILTRKEKT